MSELCNEINVDTEDRCTRERGHDGPHLGVTVYGAKTPFYTVNQEKRELANSLRRAEIHALDLAKELRQASLVVSKLFP
jgi:hypothetical protein